MQQFVNDPTGGVDALRDFYIGRIPLGTNEGLWLTMDALSILLESPADYMTEEDAARVYPELLGAGLIELLERIILDGDLFEDCTVRSWLCYDVKSVR